MIISIIIKVHSVIKREWGINMKCDVCGTKIPLGSHECPNCGYKYGKQYASDYDTNSKTHEHIKPVRNNYKIPSVKVMKERSIDKPTLKGVVIIVVVVLFVGNILFTSIGSYLNNTSSESFSAIEEMTFEEVISGNYDYKGTALAALNKEEAVVDYFKTYLNFKNPDVEEYCYRNGDEMYATVKVSYRYNNVDYTIANNYINGEQVKEALEISAISKESFRTSDNFIVDKKIVDQLGNHMLIATVYDRIDSKRSQMTLENGNHYVYSSYEDVSLYMSEMTYESRKDEYHFYCSIAQ